MQVVSTVKEVRDIVAEWRKEAKNRRICSDYGLPS